VRAAIARPCSRRTRQTDSTACPWARCSSIKARISGCGGRAPGRAFSIALARAGADIFVLSLVDNDRETEKLVTDCGRRYAYLHADITA